jgi:hypothetical protein
MGHSQRSHCLCWESGSSCVLLGGSPSIFMGELVLFCVQQCLQTEENCFLALSKSQVCCGFSLCPAFELLTSISSGGKSTKQLLTPWTWLRLLLPKFALIFL